MKAKDIQTGTKYVARVNGRSVVVRVDLFCGDSASPVYDRRPTEKDLEDAPAFPREPWEMVPVEESAKRPEYVERMKKVLRELTLSGVNDVDLPKYERAIIAVNRERYDRR